MDMRRGSTVSTSVYEVDGDRVAHRPDVLAVEEPLEIRLCRGGQPVSAGVTMRTPGHDFELAAGYLFTEGIIRDRHDIDHMSYCVEASAEQQYNIVNVYLRPGVPVDPARLARRSFVASSCGVCGKASLEAVRQQGLGPVAPGPRVTAAVLARLPAVLREHQPLFARTGGVHAAAVFDPEGRLVVAREDVGRHNAVDKVIGERLLAGSLPLTDAVLLLSGRASFEVVQKALAAGIPIVCAVSAPSSLAVDLAREFGITLVGFLRGDRFNVYSGGERLAGRSFVTHEGI